jgi:HK97 family phage prohead protease
MTDQILEEPRRGPLEFRQASLTGVDFEHRIISMVAVPYGEEALVEYRGEMWRESFLPGAFNGVETRDKPIRANRGHDKERTVGKAVNLWPSRPEGLVAEVRIAKTPLGDETLTLADEDMLSVSAGFQVRGSDQVFDRPFRRIKRAFLDHLAFVESPAYEGARVLSVRSNGVPVNAATLPPLVTPNIDDILAWLQTRQVR